ncbi:F510_1955 family glycosylhydrolase [Niallia sp.]|uniref:F510_1955 family glycosylhydrolase n=1 Tax=Niallia sp. TaxID=2837523 RepID=UPI0028A00FD8|nr:hypothetical protein [Niallia sp.]
MNNKAFVAILAVGLLLTACSSSNEIKESQEMDDNYNIEHVHGLAYSSDNSIYIATHEGLIVSSNEGEKWKFAGDADLDLMGFHIQSDGTMLTSGHPGENSDLPDPVGLLESKDNGKNWESIALKGEVDFHLLTSNESNPATIYGVIQMESGNFESGIYKSIDKGISWDKLGVSGLPKDLHEIYALVSLSNNENVLIAGTSEGVFRSEDGGQTWKIADENRIITAISAVPNSKELISYSITEEEAGMMKSEDNGLTWEKISLDLGKDAVAYFAVQPNQTNKMVAVTFENNLLISSDNGLNWREVMEGGKLKN